ncbi:ABC transporter permease [Fulvivirgaceae bacterium PWU5]|uniref:ABC transporter permease n=1 Tax=Dawidia cretensis TaxID=2782350 RepID=A0AAP2GRX2_9BACT|nr:ABC transporter permease [Dawidia cretensis]MBT1706603.1 ABC transporter permease [Dawidia cretensis]
MKTPTTTPPPLAQRLLLRFLREDLAEDVMGDLEEDFYRTLNHKKPWRARLHYWYQVIHYIRPFALRKSSPRSLNHYAMLKSYFTVGWRSLSKNKMYSSIKIGGFALGIAACMLITLFIRDELRYDTHYPDKDRIYRMYEVYNDNGEIQRGTWFQAPFARALKEDFPEVEKAGRYLSSELFGAGGNQLRRADETDNTYENDFIYMDQELLDILKFPVVYGHPSHLLDKPRTIVITKSKADKYFPNENPVGKQLVVNNDRDKPFTVGGVIADLPETSHFKFSFAMTMQGVEFWPGEQTTWTATNYPTYILLRPGTDPRAFQKKLGLITEKYLLPMLKEVRRANAEEMAKNYSIDLQSIADIHLYSTGIQDGLSHSDIRFVWLFGAIAGFIMLIACINFINLSTAKSANRAKEVGLRKTVGSHRSHIVYQFLTESLLFSVVSFVLGAVLAWLLIPYFNQLASKSLVFPWTAWQLYPMLVGATIVVGILAGIYPSFYLSSFKPISVLKGNLSRGSKNATMRSTLVVFQFATSIVLIAATVIIYRQMDYILNKNIGFDKDQVVLVQGLNTLERQRQTFKEELQQLSFVKSATLADFLPVRGTKRNGNGFWEEGKKTTEKAVGGQFWGVDHDYIQTLGMKIVEGRDFSAKMPTDSGAIIINQSMARELGLKEAVGKRIENYRGWEVIGVVEDFHFESMRGKIEPLTMVLGPGQNILSVKVDATDMAGVLSAIETVWRKFSPHQPVRYAFLDDQYANMYADVQRMGRIFVTFACLAIAVACLGLFALSAFMIEQRGKEISIRLVLGASMKNIFRLLTVNFLKLVLIALVIAIPIAWFAMQKWLEDFTYRTEITWDVFVWAGVLAVAIAVLTISYQSVRAALARPVDKLRSE